MKLKTSEARGAVLDWMVAKCEGHLESRRVVLDLEYLAGDDPVRLEPQLSTYYSSAYAPSTDWRVGGPIIEREGINLTDGWSAYTENLRNLQQGPTPLIAAMRCYVASRLGDEVDVPDDLLEVA